MRALIISPILLAAIIPHGAETTRDEPRRNSELRLMVGQTKIRINPSRLPMSQDPRSTSEISSRLVRAAAERTAPRSENCGEGEENR